jgi:formamidopyrimidine-DNA glycosylase
MPELPEVETVVRGLRATVRNHRISRITHVAPYLLEREPKLRSVAGDSFTSFSRRGKFIIASLDSGRRLLIHLRMSGRLEVKNKQERLQKHDHLVLTFVKANEKLVFRDVRKFGIVQLLEKNDLLPAELGPEATEINTQQLYTLLQKSMRPVKALLLDQTKIAGLGNIYVDESLYRAAIHPGQPAALITRDQTARLVRAIHQILRLAIKNMGTTFDSYRAADGRTGRFARLLRVYNNEGGKCRQCGGKIVKTRLAGRGTHYCPNCQKLSRFKVK